MLSSFRRWWIRPSTPFCFVEMCWRLWSISFFVEMFWRLWSISFFVEMFWRLWSFPKFWARTLTVFFFSSVFVSFRSQVFVRFRFPSFLFFSGSFWGSSRIWSRSFWSFRITFVTIFRSITMFFAFSHSDLKFFEFKFPLSSFGLSYFMKNILKLKHCYYNCYI